jgi:hypothetical protein
MLARAWSIFAASVIACMFLLVALAPPQALAAEPEHVVVFKEAGRFGGWPANYGMWNWGNEMLVGFSAGYHKDNGIGLHAIDHDRPEEHWFARSLDGGQTWSLENPGPKGVLVPRGKALHGTEVPGLVEHPWTDCPGGVDFTHPDFAMTLRMTDIDCGPSRWAYSTDRGHNWTGPFRLPDFGSPGIAARTDYIVNGPHDCLLFLTAAKADREEGRPLCARTTDGGKTWKFVSWIGPEPKGFSIMPSTVRLNPSDILTTLRVHEGTKRWIDAWLSHDNGATWDYLCRPVADTGTGNPPSLIKLADGRLCLSYGYRAAPYSMRAKLSSDNGRTWSKDYVLRDDGGGTDIGYPRSVQRPDGKVVVLYYIHNELYSERYIAATIWDPPAADAK